MSIFATLAICAWPIFAAILYLKLSPARATLWNFIAAQMFLPTVAIKFPMILSLDKATVPILCALFGVFILSAKEQKRSTITFRIETALIVLYGLSPLISSL